MQDAYDAWLEGSSEHVHSGLIEEPIGRYFNEPYLVAPDDSVRRAIELMNDKGVGSVLVGSTEELLGIFTERDVLTRVVPAGIDIDATPVSELMSPDPETLLATDRLVTALNAMVVGEYRHVPIVDEKGRPIGVFSMRHCMTFVYDLFPREITNAPPPGMRYSATREGA